MIRRALSTLAMRSGGAVAVFLLSFVVARVYGAQGAGLFFFAQAIVVGLATLARCGLGDPIIRFVAPALKRNDHRIASCYAGTGLTLVALCGFIIAVLTILVAILVLPELVPARARSWEILAIMGAAVFPLALHIFLSGVLQAMGSAERASFVETVGTPLFTMMLLVGTLLGEVELPLLSLPAFYLGAALLTLSLGFFWARRQLALRLGLPREPLAELYDAGHPLLVVNLLGYLIRYSPLLILGIWADSSDTGIFAIASRFSMLFAILLQSLNAVMRPRFAVLWNEGERGRLQAEVDSAGKFLVAVSLPLILLIAVLAPQVLSIFGAEFASGSAALLVLLAGQAVNMLTATSGALLIMSGNGRVLRMNTAVCGLTSLALSALLIPGFGLLGAAIATSTVIALQGALAALQVYRRLGIMPLPGTPRRSSK